MKKTTVFLKSLVASVALGVSTIATADISHVDTESVLISGEGYELKEIVYVDDQGISRSVELYYIHNVTGANNAYNEAGLPYQELVEIQSEVDDWGGGWPVAGNSPANSAAVDNTQFTWVIDRRAATISTEAEGLQYIEDFGLEDVVAEEQQFPEGDDPAGISGGPSARLFGCRGWREKHKSLDKDIDKQFSHDKTIGSGVATLNFEGELDIDAQVDLDLTYRYKRNFICIPYKFRFKNLDAKATYDVGGSFSLTGKVEKNFGNLNWKIADPKIMETWFLVGPIPVRLAAKLPIEVGTGDIVLTVKGEVAAVKPLHFRGNLHFSCDSSQCIKHSSNHENLSQNLQNSLGAAASAQVRVKPYVQVAIRPYLYGEWFLYAQFGVKPSFPIELFGYYGNLCQDGDNNGSNETVSALLGTIAFEIGITGEAKIFNASILSPQYWKIWEKDLRMFDFLNPGSTAFTPVLRPQVTSGQLTVHMPVSVRSCVSQYASRFPVDYTIDWNDGTVVSLDDVAASKQASHTYTTGGVYLVNVSYKNGVSTLIPIEVQGDDWGGGW